MGNCNFKQTICDANASGREHSFAPQNIYCNALFNSKEVQNVEGGQNGRSMIEMLGVLAIIGVLSVGGIAGYSKAMMKYRINKTIEQITLIAGNVRTFFGPQRNYSGLNNTILKKAKLVPDEMWNENKTKLINAFGGITGINTDICAGDVICLDSNVFSIYFDGIPTEACIELASQNWDDLKMNILYLESNDSNYKDALTKQSSLNDIVSVCSLEDVWSLSFLFNALYT